MASVAVTTAEGLVRPGRDTFTAMWPNLDVQSCVHSTAYGCYILQLFLRNGFNMHANSQHIKIISIKRFWDIGKRVFEACYYATVMGFKKETFSWRIMNTSPCCYNHRLRNITVTPEKGNAAVT